MIQFQNSSELMALAYTGLGLGGLGLGGRVRRTPVFYSISHIWGA